jgi:streptogramin lyase
VKTTSPTTPEEETASSMSRDAQPPAQRLSSSAAQRLAKRVYDRPPMEAVTALGAVSDDLVWQHGARVSSACKLRPKAGCVARIALVYGATTIDSLSPTASR